MSRRRFAIIVIAWVAAIAVCSTELGALVGFMADMAVAMFGGAVGVVLLRVASVLGFDVSWNQAGSVLLYGALGLICVFVVVTETLSSGGRAHQPRSRDIGRRSPRPKAVRRLCAQVGHPSRFF